MKVRQPTLKIFLGKINHLNEERIPKLNETAKKWLQQQTARENNGYYHYRDENGKTQHVWFDAWTTSRLRHDLEVQLELFREEMSEIYDFQMEKGLVDVHG